MCFVYFESNDERKNWQISAIRALVFEENRRPTGDVSIPCVLRYQLHPRRCPRRENVIRINNNSHSIPLPPSLSPSVRARTIRPSPFPFDELLPMTLSFRRALCRASLRDQTFPIPSRSFFASAPRSAKGHDPSADLARLSTCARLTTSSLKILGNDVTTSTSLSLWRASFILLTRETFYVKKTGKIYLKIYDI